MARLLLLLGPVLLLVAILAAWGLSMCARPVVVRVASAQKLYYSPGRKTTSAYNAELYSFDGTTHTLVWTGPDTAGFTDRWAITYLYPYGSKLLIFIGNIVGDSACRIYEYDPATGTTTLRVDDYIPYADDYSTISVFGAATYGGNILLAHAGQGFPPILMSLDPSTWDAPTFLQRVDDDDDGVGGIVASTDGYIYWNTGRYIYSSTTGEAASWSQIYDMNGTYGDSVVSEGLYLHSDGYTYTGGSYRTAISTYYRRIYAIKDNSVSVDYDNADLFVDSMTTTIRAASDGLVAVSHNGTILLDSGSGWASDGISGDDACSPQSALYKGLLYWGELDSTTADTVLARRDSAGNRSDVISYDNYTTWGNYNDTFPMAVL